MHDHHQTYHNSTFAALRLRRGWEQERGHYRKKLSLLKAA